MLTFCFIVEGAHPRAVDVVSLCKVHILEQLTFCFIVQSVHRRAVDVLFYCSNARKYGLF